MPHLFGWHIIPKNIALHINVPLVIATIIYFIQVSHPQKHNRINLYFCVTFSPKIQCFILFCDGKWNLFDIPNESQ